MAAYMPQYIFNLCAITAAKIAASSEKTIDDAAGLLSANYERSFSDSNLHNDIVEAAAEVTRFVEGVLPNSSLAANLTQLQFCAVNFEPTGKKRKKKLFGGTWFNKEKQQLPNKVQQCATNVATYHFLVVNGTLPLAPEGWSI